MKPGSVVEVPGTFANKGAEALDKIYLSYGFSDGLAFRGKLPSNCLLRGTGREIDAGNVVCEFDQTVKAGGIYAPEKTLSLDVLGHALNEMVSVIVSTYDPSPDGFFDTWPGTGPTAKLIELPSTTPVGDGDHPFQVGDAQWDSSELLVYAVNTADFQMAVRGTDRVGKAGTMEATFTNAGPASVA